MREPRDPFMNISFANEPEPDSKRLETEKHIESRLASVIREHAKQVNPLVYEYFKDVDLFLSLPEEVRKNDEALLSIILHTSAFADLIHTERRKIGSTTDGLFGEDVQPAETVHADGRKRTNDLGYSINLDYLKRVGIDPTKVLFFRITQPSAQPKPELFWTSDYFETRRGLTREIAPEQRNSAVILVTHLESINNNAGLIQDINDDNGLAVRQVGNGTFDQKNAVAVIEPNL